MVQARDAIAVEQGMDLLGEGYGFTAPEEAWFEGMSRRSQKTA